MFWFIYSITSIFLSISLARISRKYFSELFFFFLLVLNTPAQIEVLGSEYAPSVFTFFFNIFFQEEFSSRVLRPLILSIPLGLLSIFLFVSIKRKFF